MTGNEITIRKRFTGVLTALAVFLAMTIQIMPAMAKTPEKESVKYEGGGRVEVEFYGDVEWKNTKVKVKDTSGKRYKTTIIKYDDDEIEFKIKKYKKGKTYKFSISKVRRIGTGSYGTVKGKVKIPKEKTSISRSAAKKKAVNHAVSHYNIKKSTIMDLSIEKDHYGGKAVWEIEFDAKKKGNGWCEYDYKISRSSGKILFHDEEYDD